MIDVVMTLAGPWADGTRPKDLFALHIAAGPAAYVPGIVAGIRDGKGKAQAGCAELASLVSEQNAEALWPYRATSSPTTLRRDSLWCAGRRSACWGTSRPSTRAASSRPTSPRSRRTSPTQASSSKGTLRTLGKMARAYPGEAAGILEALTASAASFPGTRVGFVVEVMGAFADDPAVRPAARAFAEPHVRSDLPSVAAKARKTMRALGG